MTLVKIDIFYLSMFLLFSVSYRGNGGFGQAKVGGTVAVVASGSFLPTQILPSPNSWKFSQRSFSGHWKSVWFMSVSQLCLALSQTDLQGGMARSKIVHTGAYTKHRKNFSSDEQFVFIKGSNCRISRSACSWL